MASCELPQTFENSEMRHSGTDISGCCYGSRKRRTDEDQTIFIIILLVDRLISIYRLIFIEGLISINGRISMDESVLVRHHTLNYGTTILSLQNTFLSQSCIVKSWVGENRLPTHAFRTRYLSNGHTISYDFNYNKKTRRTVV